MKWDNLTMSQKQALMKIYVNNGVTNLDEIRNHYNRFGDGGFTNPYKQGDTYTESDECAYFSNHTLNDQGYMMSGNAWTPRGGDLIYSGFTSQKKPKYYSEKEYDKYVTGAVEDFYNNFNTKDTLDNNKVYTVNMYYRRSPNKELAFNQGKDVYGTHTGYLNFDPADKQWYVTHNIHGKVHKQRFFDLQKPGGDIGVTAIFEPRKNTIGNRIRTKLGFAEGGSIETVESPNTVMCSRTPRELASNIVTPRPVPGLITMTEVPRVGAGINLPFKELIDRFVLDKTNTPNIINTDSIVTRTPVSYIGMPTRINRFDGGGYKSQSDNTRVQVRRTDVEPIKIPDEELKWMGWKEQTYPNGETYMVPPLATGALTPVYPEFELLTGFKGILNQKTIDKVAKNLAKPLTNSEESVGDILGFYQRKGIKNAYADKELQKAVEKIETTIDDVNDFYVEDAIPRMRQINDEKIVDPQKVEEMLDEITYNILDNKGDEIGGFAVGDEVFIPKDPGRWDMDQIVTHENHHALRSKYGDTYTNQSKIYNRIAAQEDPKFRAKNAFGYTKKEQDLLNEAYSFTDDYLENTNITPIFEKGATNTEIRRHISKKYNNVTGRKLDLIIDNLSDNDLLELLEEHNGYSRNFKKYYDSLSFVDRITKLENMRTALKRVGEYGIPLYFTGEVLQNKEK